MTYIVGSGNPNIGVVQTTNYLDRIESLPYSQIAISVFGETVDIPSYKAETHTMRSWEQIDISHQSLTPLNTNVLNAERIESISGSVVTLKTEIHGVTIVISEKSRVNSPENIFSATSTLLSDYEMRLKERIILNMLNDSNLVEYTFENGGSGSLKKMNIIDMINLTTEMEDNLVAPLISFIPANPDTYTRPVPTRYAFVGSIRGTSAIKKNLSADEFTQTHRFAGISSYEFQSKGSIDRANMEIYATSELEDVAEAREAFIFGAQPFYKTGNTPINSTLNIRPSSESSYGLHSKVEKVTTFGCALSNQNRVIKALYAD